MPMTEKPLEFQPQLAAPQRIDATERFLLRVFLRRYVTWCARRGAFYPVRKRPKALVGRALESSGAP